MIIVSFLGWILFLYLGYFSLYRIYTALSFTKSRIKELERKNYNANIEQKLTIVIYSHNNASTIVNLVESLKRQDYNNSKYSINVILDNSTDNTDKLLEILGGTKLWRVSNENKTLGKNKAIIWLLDRIISTDNTSAFVFLDADYVVKPDFLSNINTDLYHSPVVIADVQPLNHNPSLFTGIYLYSEYLLKKVLHKGRILNNLGIILNNNIWAIKQELLEKIKLTKNSKELEMYEYSLKLKKYDIKPLISSNSIAYKHFNITYNNLCNHIKDERIKSLNILRQYNGLLLSKSPNSLKELVLSFMYPSGFTFILMTTLLGALTYYTFDYRFEQYSQALLCLYFTGAFIILVNAKAKFIDIKNAILSAFFAPFLYISSILPNFSTNKTIHKRFNLQLPKINLMGLINILRGTRKVIVHARVTDGSKELLCNLEIIRGSRNSQIVLRFNDKKLSTGLYYKIDDAIAELSDKLKVHGFALKVCYNCGYFKTNTDSTFCEQGYCLFNNFNRGSRLKESVYIWDFCSNILPIQTRENIHKKLGL